MLPSRRFLATGAAGFIGSHTAIRLLERGDAVVGVDNFNDYYDPARKRTNFESERAAGKENGTFTFVEGDMRNAVCSPSCWRASVYECYKVAVGDPAS